jgi:hypothetical protein
MIYAVQHTLGVSLVKARTALGAVAKCRRQFGECGYPYSLPQNQEQAISWAQAMGAGVVGGEL